MTWRPSRAAGLQRLAEFLPRAGAHYGRTRNFDEGWDGQGAGGPQERDNVSGLSPWLQRRLLLESEVIQAAVSAHGHREPLKFVEEVVWRTYFKGWLAQRPSVWTHYRTLAHSGLAEIQASTPRRRSFERAIAGNTGIEPFDHWVQELMQTGYLHNHARMWFSSIWIFTLKLPWELGAALFERHLLDFDPASNTLGWRWVAGLHTRGKVYAARAENIATLTGGRFDPAGALDENPEPVTEDVEHPSVPLRSWPAPAPGPRTGVLVTTEDLLLERSELAELEHVHTVAGGVPAALCDAQRYADPVRAFHRASLDDGLSRAGHHFGTEPVRLPDGADWLAAALDWAGTHRLQRVSMIAPQVGPWQPPIAELSDLLHAAGVHLTCTRRAWDHDLYPHASRGFFRFKKVLPELLRDTAAS